MLFQKLKLYMGLREKLFWWGEEGDWGVEGNKAREYLLAEVGRRVRLLSR